MNSTAAIAEEFKQYAYSVSHDLSAPVRAMVAFSQLLTNEHKEVLDEEGQQYLDIIIENGKKLQAMMDALLQYSRLNTTAKPFADVDADLLLQECREAMAKKLSATGAQFEIGTMPTVCGDHEQLGVLFRALIDNAITFQVAGSTPKIRVAAERVPGFWCFHILDNGIGIMPKYAATVFGLFHRLHTDDEYPGVGAGLALAKKVIERHGGMIGFDTAARSGAHVYFTLPCMEKNS